MRNPTIDIREVLNLIRPGAECVLIDNDFERLEWLDQSQPKPTWDEILSGFEQLKALDYQNKRRPEYPSLSDQLDALWKGGAEMEAMRQKVMAVKAKYPKP